MNNETLKLLEEFNRYFTSSNDVDVPVRVNVSRDEWRQLYKRLKEQNTRHVPMTREQAVAIVQSNPDTMTAIRMTETHHGITAQCANTNKKEGV